MRVLTGRGGGTVDFMRVLTGRGGTLDFMRVLTGGGGDRGLHACIDR